MTEILGEALEMELGYGAIVQVIGDAPAGSFCGMPPTYDRKADEIAAVAGSYYNNRFDGSGNPRFRYSWQNTYRSENFLLGSIDCSALVGLVMRGIAYADSPYGKAYAAGGRLGDEIPGFDPDSVACNKNMSWAINPADYWCLGNYRIPTNPEDPESEEEDTDSGTTETPAQGRPLSAANLAQLLLTMGYAVPLTGGFSAIKKGDFLFWASKYETGEHAGEYKRPNRFLRISHVAVCVDVDEHGDHWYVDSMSEDYAPENTIRKECLETGIPKAEYLVLAIRLRHGRAWERIRILYNPQDREMAVGERQRFTCIAEGDIMHYQWQFSDDGGETWTNSTLPKMASVSVTASLDMDGRLYHCVCTDTHGRSLTSRNALITILPSASAVEEG